jgi:hypothetical protein
MYTRIFLDEKQLTIDFSSAKDANNFIRGYNEWRANFLQGNEFPTCNESERRGASFAETISRYARVNNIKLSPDELQLFDNSENKLSLFDSF